MRSPIQISVLFLLALSLAAAGAAGAAGGKRRGGSDQQQKKKNAAGGAPSGTRAPEASHGKLPRGSGGAASSATVHKQKLVGGDRLMAEIARSPGLPSAPVADSYIRGKLFFGDPAPTFRGSRAQKAILQLARRSGGSLDGTFELSHPTTRKVVGYYSQISTGASSGLHVFHDRMGRRVATTPFSY